jgi:hypothetical protein
MAAVENAVHITSHNVAPAILPTWIEGPHRMKTENNV